MKQWICNAAFASDNILVNQAKQRKCQEEINQSDKSPQLNSPLTDRRLSLRWLQQDVPTGQDCAMCAGLFLPGGHNGALKYI